MAAERSSISLFSYGRRYHQLIKWLVILITFYVGVLIIALLFFSTKGTVVLPPKEHFQLSFTTYNDTRTLEEALLSIVSSQLDPYFGVPSLERNTYPLPRAGHFRITQESLNAMEFIAAHSNLGVRIRIVDGGKRLIYRRLTKLLYSHLNQRLMTLMQLIEEMMSEGYFQHWNSFDGVDFILLLHGPASGIHSHALANGLPIFTFISTVFHSDLILPDPTQFGAHGTYVWPNVSQLVPWSEKQDRVVFRGKGDCYNFHTNNWFSCTRVRAARLSTMYPKELDVALTEFNHLNWETPPFVYHKKGQVLKGISQPPTTEQIESQTNLTLAKFMSFREQSAYKYILDIDGSMGSGRKGHIIGSGSVLFSQESPWKRWFEPLLVPYVHYVPVDANLKELRNKVLWARENDEYMQKITRWGMAFQEKFLRKAPSKLYIKLLLDGYRHLLVDNVTTANVTTNYCALEDYKTLTKQILRGPLGCSPSWIVWSKYTTRIKVNVHH